MYVYDFNSIIDPIFVSPTPIKNIVNAWLISNDEPYCFHLHNHEYWLVTGPEVASILKLKFGI